MSHTPSISSLPPIIPPQPAPSVSPSVSRPSSPDVIQAAESRGVNPAVPSPAPTPVNWPSETNHALNILIQNASAFSIITLMDATLEAPQVLELLAEIDGDNSIFDVYMRHHKSRLSWTQRIAARCRYALLFKTGLLANAVESCMFAFMDILRTDLVHQNGGRNLTTLIRTLLNETNSFLGLYLQALDHYANGVNLQGNRDAQLSYELTNGLGLSKEEICHRFSQTICRQFLPRVNLFPSLQNSSWRIVRSLGNALNNTARKKTEDMLPSILLNVLKISTDITQPNNLSFVIPLLDSLLDALKTFRLKFEQSASNPSAPKNATLIAGADQLPEVVKKFLQVINKEPCQNRQELQQQAHQTRLSPIPGLIQQQVEEQSINGANAFLTYLTNPENSEELFCNLLLSINKSFQYKPQETPQNLAIKYENLQRQLSEEFDKFFQSVVVRSVNEVIRGITPQQLEQMISDYQTQLQSQSQATAQSLIDIYQPLFNKISSIISSPFNPSNDITPDLNQIIEAITSYRAMTAFDQFPAPIKQEISETITPILTVMGALLEQTSDAKQTYQSLVKHQLVFPCLSNLYALLKNTRDFQIQDYKDLMTHLQAICSENSPTPAFAEAARTLSTFSSEIEKNSQILQALRSLDAPNGLLRTLRTDVRQHIATPTTPSPHINPLEIPGLEPQEQIDLQNAILSVATSQDEQAMGAAWNRLKLVMHQIFAKYHDRQIEIFRHNRNLMRPCLHETETSIPLLNQHLFDLSHFIAQSIQDFERRVENVHIHNKKTVSSRVYSAINTLGGLPAVAGAVAGGILSTVAMIHPLIGLPLLGTYAFASARFNGITAATTALVVQQIFPPAALLPIAGGILDGYLQGQRVPESLCNSAVLPEAKKIFNNLCHFIIQPHIWRWTMFDALKCIDAAYRPVAAE